MPDNQETEEVQITPEMIEAGAQFLALKCDNPNGGVSRFRRVAEGVFYEMLDNAPPLFGRAERAHDQSPIGAKR